MLKKIQLHLAESVSSVCIIRKAGCRHILLELWCFFCSNGSNENCLQLRLWEMLFIENHAAVWKCKMSFSVQFNSIVWGCRQKHFCMAWCCSRKMYLMRSGQTLYINFHTFWAGTTEDRADSRWPTGEDKQWLRSIESSVHKKNPRKQRLIMIMTDRIPAGEDWFIQPGNRSLFRQM